MFEIFSSLYRAKLLNPIALFRMLRAIAKHGVNLMAVLHFSAWQNPKKIAIADDDRQINYQELLAESLGLAANLETAYGINAGDKVALLCRNQIRAVEALIAVSGIGADCYLLSTELAEKQLKKLIERGSYKVVITDDKQCKKLKRSSNIRLLSLPELSIKPLVKEGSKRIKKYKAGKIVVFCSGTTGDFKTTERKPSSTSYLSPFLAVLVDLKLYKYDSVYIATPIYHGFALAALVISLLLSSTVYFLEYFDAEKASRMILKNKIEVASLVPLMLKRMLKNPERLKSLNLVISGSAPLSPELIKEANKKLGQVVANLYGTSEAGFTIMASPADLKKEPESIGKAIRAVSLKVVGEDGVLLEPKQIGLLYTKAKWSMSSKKSQWIKTGDLAYIDEKGYVYLCGRVDKMIVSGGENVYPIALEKALKKHPIIYDVKIITLTDNEFGQRLKAYLQIEDDSKLREGEVRKYLQAELARFQMPKEIIIVDDITRRQNENS